jgi:DNA-binding MarR family transcriptional regulator
MRSIDTDIIEQILLLNNMLLKISEKTLFRGISLTPQQFNVLGEIILAKKMSVNVLKDKLILSSPALSQMLKRMENA